MTGAESNADPTERIERALTDRFDAETAERATLEKLGGHASMRVYWRIRLPSDVAAPSGEDTLIAMVLAPDYDPAASAEGPEDERLDADDWPFVEVQRYLDGLGLPVPAIVHVDRDAEVLLLEDLGDQTFGDACREITGDTELDPPMRLRELEGLYEQALQLLVDMQSALLESRRRRDGPVEEACICWRRRFDRSTLRWELDHYVDWGLDARESIELEPGDRETLDDAFDRLVDALLDLDQIPVHRDFQSSNLMRKHRPDREHPWVVIDFQDALVGPFVYDVVSLLRDSYIELPFELVSELLATYVEMGADAGLEWCESPDEVRRAFHLQTVQRKLKDAGRFVFIDRRKDDPSFLEYYEPSIRYVDDALRQLGGRAALRDTLRRLEPSLE